MDGFNLLAEEYRTRQGARFAPISMLVTLGITVLCVLLIEHAVLVRAISGSGSSLGETLIERRKELKERSTDRQKVADTIKPLEAVLARTPVWSNVLVDLATVTGPDVRITQLSADTGRGLCTIQGRAKTNAAVFAFAAALEGLEHFDSVTLAGVTKEKDTKEGEVRYEVVCSMRKAAQ